jgi:hypothetical protein
VAAVSECLDSVREMLSGLDDTGITQALRDIEALSRRTHAVMLDLVAEIDREASPVRSVSAPPSGWWRKRCTCPPETREHGSSRRAWLVPAVR